MTRGIDMELKEFKNYEEVEDFFDHIGYRDDLDLILELIRKGFKGYNWREKFIEYWNKGLMEAENNLILKQCTLKSILMICLINELRAL
jgi:hypothetical protein